MLRAREMPVTTRYSATLDRSYEERSDLQKPLEIDPRVGEANGNGHGRTDSLDSVDDRSSAGTHSPQVMRLMRLMRSHEVS